MTSTVSSAPINAADQSRTNAASASATGATSPLSTVPAQPAAAAAVSYANATKRQAGPPAVVASSSSPAQHASQSSASPVNGKTNIPPPAVPSVGPPIVNSSGVANGSADHA
ncbi:MAG: hypothetical protein INR71_15545, partial [Terriglobus roseus]|nr:hypothetical protein [Terriglobus roseus]